jgi:hypothetical protein
MVLTLILKNDIIEKKNCIIQISDLTTLVSDSSYHHVADIYLDYNEIENVDKLEGAAWLSNFRVFSIKYNKIKVVS